MLNSMQNSPKILISLSTAVSLAVFFYDVAPSVGNNIVRPH